MPTFHSPNVPTIRTTASPYFGGNVAVNGSDWLGLGEIAAQVGSNLFEEQSQRRERDARVGLLNAQTENEIAQTKDRRDVTSSRIAGREAIANLFGQVGPAPDENTPPEERQRWGFSANQASEAVINAIASGTLDANEAVATLSMLFNPGDVNGGPVGMTEEDRRRGNYGVDLADGSVNENDVFSENEGNERYETSEANDLRQASIGANATIRSAEIGAESRERIADRRIAAGGGGGGGNRVQNQGRSLTAARGALLTALGRPTETQLRGMDERRARQERERTAQILRDNQISIGRLADAYNSDTYNAAAFNQFARDLATNPNAPTPAIFQGRGDAPAAAAPSRGSDAGGGSGRSPPAAPARQQAGPPVGFDEDNNLVDSYGNVVLTAREVEARRGRR